MSATQAATPTNAETIVRGFATWAAAPLREMIELTEEITRTLAAPVRPTDGEIDAMLLQYQRGNAETRAQLYPALRAVATLKRRREKRAMDLADFVREAERSLGWWIASERQAAEIEKADLPPTSDPAELARRADSLARAQALSSVAPAALIEDAERLLAADHAEEADVRLRALQLAGHGRWGSYASLRRRCDEALDRLQPRRAAIVAAQAEATLAYVAADRAVHEIADASRALLSSPPDDPSAEVAAARALIARYEP